MNDEHEITVEQLIAATSRRPAEVPGTDDSVAQRESFLALGRGLQIAADRGDETKLIARLEQWADAQKQPAQATRKRRSELDSRWPLALGTALALSIVLVVTQVLTNWNKPMSGLEIAKNELDPAGGKFVEQSNSSLPEQDATNAVSLPWQDSLDGEIASAQASLQRIAGGSTNLDGSLNDMNQRLQSLTQEWSSERL